MNVTCLLSLHESVLISLIIFVGGFAGLINALRNTQSDSFKARKSHYIFSGIGAAILVPLFLNMLSSNLIKYTKDYDTNNYFIFAGFCFIAGYFSDRFINSIGEKVLKELQQTKEKIKVTDDKLEKTTQDLKENKEKVDVLVDTESELDDSELNDVEPADLKLETKFIDDDPTTQMQKIVSSFSGKYKFRTIKGIAKDLNYTPLMVEIILTELERNGAVKKFTNSDSRVMWALTKIGQIMNQKEN